MKKYFVIISASLILAIFAGGIFGAAETAIATDKSAAVLRWVDEETGQELFGIDDIVRFDWERQIFELTRRSAMDLIAELSSVGVQGRKFILTDSRAIIYKGTLVTSLSSMVFLGPVIGSTLTDDDIKPPLFEIGGGYPRDFEKGDTRFSERLKKALQQASLLGEIDVNNPPLPIETITQGWFGKKEDLRALIEVFPETFRLRRSARFHIHLTGDKDLDENHVFDVNASLISKDGEGRFSTKRIFPFHGTGWKNIYVLEMNPWEDRVYSSSRVKPGCAKLSVEVSTRKVLDERAKTYSEPIDHVKTDAIDVWIQPGRALLPETSEKVMIRFQKAIKDSNWPKALEYSSNKIKSKAEEYDSAEAFFKDVLPIDEIAALKEFEVSGRSFLNKVASYRCEIKLKDPNYRWPLNWNLSVLKEDSNWVVEFPSKPLKIWLKHEVLKRKVSNDGLRFGPEKIRDGFDVSLIPLSENFIIGQPMLFRIEMKNISNETLGSIGTMSAMVNDPMLVKDSNGTIVPYIDTSYQTSMGKDFLEPGETIVLADNYDVRSQYHIVTPGKYTFQFKGLHQTKPSNMVEIYIMPGELSLLESVVEKLVPILPEGWRLTRHLSDPIWVHLIGKPRRKGKDRGIGLFIYVYPDKSNLRDEFLDQAKWGPVYIKSLNAELLWPDYKKQITKALVISTAKAGIINPVVRAKEVRPAKDIETIVAGNSDFTFELYKQLRETEGNLFFSPYSISTALALTYAGARNDTEKQMSETLHFDLRQNRFHSAFGKLQKQLNEQGKKGDYQLSVANALWLQKDYELQKAFIDLNKTHYDAGLNRVNFKTQAEKARKTINEWVEKKTNQKIKNLIPAGTLDAMTRLVLTNAVYFKGDWASQFDPKDTEEADFYITSGGKVKADLMYKKADFNYAEIENIQILELPYKGDDLSMVVLLPKKNCDMTTLEESLTTENLSKWLKILHSREVIVHLPKFKLTSRFELASLLGKMGMPDAFSPRADFSGMTGSRDLFIAAVLHKAYVDVNEEGTEAAAATGIVMKLTAMPTPPPVFRADHPFVFMIKDNTSSSILFIGRLTNPAEKAE